MQSALILTRPMRSPSPAGEPVSPGSLMGGRIGRGTQRILKGSCFYFLDRGGIPLVRNSLLVKCSLKLSTFVSLMNLVQFQSLRSPVSD